ncbi:MAG TPA: methyltransferase [Dehalococcoidia bacterium]|nr:methyltransferase [Dehalococcoidia bacterium]
MQADTADAPSAALQVPPHAQVIQMATAYWVSRAVYAAAYFGIADQFKDGPRSAEQLAAATGTHAGALGRVLRTLASVGLFRTNEEGEFALTPLGATLQADAPGAARSTVIALAGDWFWAAWGEVLHAVRTGETGVQKALGASEYQYLEQHPEQASHFNAAMIGYHGAEPAAIVEAYDFSGFGRAVDVGGGSGNLLATILAANPNLQGVLLDRPQVVPDAERNLSAAGMAGRCQVVGGDFLEAVPEGGDGYIVSHCIHNWDEASCVRILANCRRAMQQSGRLLIIEAVVRPGDEPDPAKILDLAMLLVPGGQERSQDEYRILLDKAGFRLTRVVPTRTSASVIEAVAS